MVDQYGRTIDYMRISITDRCNLRCVFCMPEAGVKSVPHSDILTYEEILRVVRASAALGISKYKITGGEPLVRKGVVDFICRLKQTMGVESVTLTTNGILFKDAGTALAQCGLDGVNFSLSGLSKEAFCKISRRDEVETVLGAIGYALELGLKTKVNCVPLRPYNEAELIGLARMAKKYPLSVRFIELMPIGIGAGLEFINNDEVLQILEREFGKPLPSPIRHGNGPARYFDFPDFNGNIGFISALSHTFCASCNRIRLTSTGVLKQCLCYNSGTDIKQLLRGGASEKALKDAIADTIYNKPLVHNFRDKASETTNMSQIGG